MLNLLEISAVSTSRTALAEISSRLAIYDLGVEADVSALEIGRTPGASDIAATLADMAIGEIRRTRVLVGQLRLKASAK